MKQPDTLLRQNVQAARLRYPSLSRSQVRALINLTRTLRLSVLRGEVLCIEGKWYISHAGLLQVALRHRCIGIRTALQERQSDPVACRWVFKAIVYKSRRSKGFVGYGDANPSNVSSVVQGAEMRVAETRAVNRALRKAYGIGLCSVEELGGCSNIRTSRAPSEATNGSQSSNGNGRPRLRDQLCLLIREYRLDAELVKRYAADFCGSQTLSGASRELVESFVSHLATAAKQNRDALVSTLNSYAQPTEVKS